MRRLSSLSGPLAALWLLGTAACDNELPTLNSDAQFPGGRPVSVELTLSAADFLRQDTVYTGFTDPRAAPFLLVASSFGSAPGLEAHALRRFTGFPDTLRYTDAGVAREDTSFTYAAGRVVARLDTLSSARVGPVTLRLWELGQAWDAGTVTWELARDSGGVVEPWRQPGGTRATELARATFPSDTLFRDSVVWAVDSLTVARMAGGEHPGLMVTVDEPARLQITELVLRAGLRPASRPDTVLQQVVSGGAAAFVANPPAPAAGGWPLGGLNGARAVFQLQLPQRVPACAGDPAGCGTVALSEVLVNEAALLLAPLGIGDPFRPVGATLLQLRRLLEPELGRRSPLGGVLAQDTVSARLFETAGSDVFRLPITSYVRLAAATDSLSATVALVSSGEGLVFGLPRFSDAPRLRLVYTLRAEPRLP